MDGSGKRSNDANVTVYRDTVFSIQKASQLHSATSSHKRYVVLCHSVTPHRHVPYRLP